MGKRYRLRRGCSKAIRRLKDHEIAAPFPCLRIPLIAQQSVCMLNGNGADTQFLRQHPLGGQSAVVWVHLVYDIVPDQLI